MNRFVYKDGENEALFMKNVVALRKNNLFTQDDMANYLGIKRSRYGAWEEGRAFPSIKFMLKMCELFKTGLIEMLTTNIEVKVSPDRLFKTKRIQHSIY